MALVRVVASLLVLSVALHAGAADEAAPYTPAAGGFALSAGGAVLGARDAAGAALMLAAGLRAGPALLIAEGWLGADTGRCLDVFAGAAGGLRLPGRLAPYALGGAGYFARGWFDTRGHDVLAMTGELGLAYAWTPWAELWVGLRGILPVSQQASFNHAADPPPPIPFLAVTARVVAFP